MARELSDLADATLEGALAVARKRVGEAAGRIRLAVVALGKTGAQELNYISDVDVLFVAESGAGAEDGLAVNAGEALRVATRLAAELSRICSANTRAGTIWEVDAATPPGGSGRAVGPDAGQPTAAYYACPECGSCVEERRKSDMVAKGRWRATAPDVEGHAGFRVNALVSPLANASWGKLAVEFLAAKNDPDSIRTFVNTILAEGTGDDGDTGLDEVELLGRVEPFGIGRIPEEVLYLTVGVDVQDDRLEVAVVGWDRDGTAFVLDHQMLFGSPGEDATWKQLDELLTARWKHPLGGTIGIDAACVDSGDGDWTATVYKFCFPRARRRVMAIKGMFGSRPIIERSRTKAAGGSFWIVGVDGIKRTIVDRLTRDAKLRFSDSLPLVWFEQLASERRVVRYSRGQPIARWERKPGRAAEALDCTVYAFAARQVVGSNFDNRDAELRQEQKPVVRPRTIKSEWMNNQ